MGITARGVLDSGAENEVILDILSYSAGINKISEDHVMQANEARTVENWTALSIGGMERSKGIDLIASSAGATASDLAHFHYEDSTGQSAILGIVGGALVESSSPSISTITGGVFTSGVLSHAVEGEDESWITNATDNLRKYTISGGLTTPSDQPAVARERIYRHKNRLIAEGGGTRIYGSRVGVGNWEAANGWTLSNDAWDVDLPNNTKGCAPGFPSGNLVTVFDQFQAYTLSNFPAVAFNAIPNSKGCAAPYSIAVGNEGLYFVSGYPTLGVFVWNGTQFLEITKTQDFIQDIDLSKRVFGLYRDQRYYLIYNEKNSGVTYPNRIKIFDEKFGRWMTRVVSDDLADNIGYPMLLTKQNNEIYAWSSRKNIIYQLEATNDSDNGNNTEATYVTKDFTSKDFVSMSSGKGIPYDDLLFKVHKITLTYYGTVGTITVKWNIDRGRVTGTKTFDLTAGGDLINSTFTINTSQIISSDSLSDKKVTSSVTNSAVGRTLSLEVRNEGSSTRPKIKKIKVHATVLSDV